MTGYQSKRAAAQDKLDSMEREALKLALEEYLCREMPAGTVIGDPKFWVPRIAIAIKAALAQPAQEPVAKYCCHVCFNKSGQTFLDRMIICSECGNKRCPKATNHALPCTDSNEPNQAGSVFTNTPQPAQEPVAWMTPRIKDHDGDWVYDFSMYRDDYYVFPVYTAPPQRTWVGLTDEMIEELFQSAAGADEETHIRFARAIENALRSKNT